MKLDPTPRFEKNLRQFPKEIRVKLYKQANFLLQNIRHPSLHAKKYNRPLSKVPLFC